MAASFNHRLNISPTSIANLDTASCFNTTYAELEKSPIDNFFEKIINLNLIQSNQSHLHLINSTLIPTQNNLIVLGYISAVESYLREIIRKLIVSDIPSRSSSHTQAVNYGAAVNYPAHLLPEALLEKSSYASKSNILDSIKTFLGVKGPYGNELETSLDEFEIICQLRHCIVHRFGKLGSYNAIRFGFDKHVDCLEKPLDLDAAKIFEIYTKCQNVVLVLNQFLYSYIIKRTTLDEYSFWTWDYRRDRKLFKQYFDLFYSTINGNTAISTKEAYELLRAYKLS